MTNNKNDERILDLQQSIKKKKKEIGGHKTMEPITNCNLELNGTKHNIHLLNKEQLLHLIQLDFGIMLLLKAIYI